MSSTTRRTAGSSTEKSRVASRKKSKAKSGALTLKAADLDVPEDTTVDDPLVLPAVLGTLANHDRRIAELEEKLEKVLRVRGKASDD